MDAALQAEAIADYIWRLKYRQPDETTLAHSLQRVARTVAGVEAAPEQWELRFRALLQSGRFLPGGRILAGAGTGRAVTLFNCFVQGPVPDSLDGICNSLREAALTLQAGGGIGCDFSTLRPRGAACPTTGNRAAGPVSFLPLWNSMCATLLAGSTRRGAMMATLRCDHPDIGLFIDAKRQPGALPHFNLSVQVTAAFLQAVADDADWPLLFPLHTSEAGAGTVLRPWTGQRKPVPCTVLRSLPARALWQQLMDANYACGEPGVLFVDRINTRNNLHWCEQLTCSNPCGEIPLPPHGACNLGSLVLPHFVQAPFTAAARIDFAALADCAALATRLLDNVIDCSSFPLPAQADQARHTRRVGLGLTGLGDALLMLGLHYGTPEARTLGARCMQCICHAAYRSSVALAREKGVFPAFAREPLLAAPFIRELPEDIRAGIARDGLRNSHLLAIAPAGSISLLAGNVSSGIEPVYAWEQRRRVRTPEGGEQVLHLGDRAWQQWRALHGAAAALPACFVTALELPPRAHLLMQAALQPYVDNAISKTINVPADCSRAGFEQLYLEADALGLKGCTTFRHGCRDSVLDSADDCRHCDRV